MVLSRDSKTGSTVIKCIFAIIAVLCLVFITSTVYGQEKINTVSLRFTAEEFDEEEAVVTAEAKGSTYYVNHVSSSFEYYGEDTYSGKKNVYVVELAAEDGYYFNITKAASISLNGAGAKFLKAARQDNGGSLIITAELTKMEEFLGEIEAAGWSDNGFAEWETAPGATMYSLLITTSAGKTKKVETGGTTYDFNPFMQTAGDYSYRVRPMNQSKSFGEWEEGGSFTVTQSQADSNREKYFVETYTYYIGEGIGPSNCVTEYKNTGWQQEEGGKSWYRKEDGSYPQNVWWQEGSKWYYFGGDGYRKADEYMDLFGAQYYFDHAGQLVTDGKTPDGRWAGSDGVISQ